VTVKADERTSSKFAQHGKKLNRFVFLARGHGPDLRAVLKRDGECVVCPELGARYPVAA